MPKKALVTVSAFGIGKMLQKPVVVVTTQMSTDLPTENLGEILTDCLQEVWSRGNDPVNYTFVVEFD